MTLTQPEKDEIFDHTKTWFQRLAFPNRPPSGDLVWHYTGGDGLLGILRTRSLFATQLACVNDLTESRYAATMLRSALEKRAAAFVDGPAHTLLQYYASVIDEQEEDTPNHAYNRNYVTSFSMLRDDLSQWRAYGGGENGYALGFSPLDFLGLESTILGSVNYQPEEHISLASEIAEVFERLFVKFSTDERRSDPLWHRYFAIEFDIFLSRISPFAKDPGFRAEQEFRLVRFVSIQEETRLEFRQKSFVLARHFPLTFGPIEDPKHLPIREILIGPSRHKGISRQSVLSLLCRHGYPTHDIEVNTSKIPFQST